MPHEMLFSLLDEIQNTIKMDTRESERTEIWKKSKKTRASCFDIYIVVFAFLSSTIEEGRR